VGVEWWSWRLQPRVDGDADRAVVRGRKDIRKVYDRRDGLGGFRKFIPNVVLIGGDFFGL